MKKIIDTLKNIWSIDELRNRIIFTLTLLLVYRVGCQIVLPGINPNENTISYLPLAARTGGFTYKKLIDIIIKSAIKRYS